MVKATCRDITSGLPCRSTYTYQYSSAPWRDSTPLIPHDCFCTYISPTSQTRFDTTHSLSQSTSPSCIAHTLCASRARRLRRKSRTHRHSPRPPRAVVSLAVPTLVCRESSSMFIVHRLTTLYRPHIPQVGPPRRFRSRSRQEAVAAREDGEERHAINGTRGP